MSRSAAVLFALLFTTSLAADIEVLPVRSQNEPLMFDCGAKCVFRGGPANQYVRVRIIHGTKAHLLQYGEAFTGANACAPLVTLVTQPTRWRDLVNLSFYFNPDWLDERNGSPSDGAYVFIFEKADGPPRPNGQVATPEVLNVPSSVYPEFINSGVEIGVRAPHFAPSRTPRAAESVPLTTTRAETRPIEAAPVVHIPLPPHTPCAPMRIASASSPIETADGVKRAHDVWIAEAHPPTPRSRSGGR